MNSNGWNVLRVWYSDVLQDRSTVLEMIVAALDGRMSEKSISAETKFIPVAPTPETGL